MRGERELYRDKIEVSLDGKQVFYLFFGGATIACLVFVLGVMVGRRLESRAHVDAIDAPSAASSDPLAALDLLAGSGGGDDLSFPTALAEPEPQPEAEPDSETDSDSDSEADSEAEAEPEASAAAKPEEAKPEKPVEPRYTLQLSSFQEESEANTFHEQLRGAGYQPYMVRAEVPEKGTFYRVRLGKYATYDEALEAKAEFEDAQHIIAYVTRL